LIATVLHNNDLLIRAIKVSRSALLFAISLNGWLQHSSNWITISLHLHMKDKQRQALSWNIK